MEEGQVLIPALLDALRAQNAVYGPSPAREESLSALAGGARAVVTGQQVGLFLGPLFTLYKTATAVNLARSLSRERREPVVPVFWLQNEDHDLAEIARCDVAPARGASLSIELPAPAEHVSVAHRVLPPEVTDAVASLRSHLEHLPRGSEHLDRIARHYRPGAGWSAAFAGVLAELFSDEGLVLLDPRDPALASLAAPIHRRAIVEAKEIAEALTAPGVEPVVHVRPGSPLSFFHPDGPEGPRFRLAPEGDGWAEVGGSRVHSTHALLDALERRPACFSTSALLRPILQDTWLPTEAYVGGPAEVRYFEQLPPLYAAYGIPMPRIVQRARFRLLEERTRRGLARAGVSAAGIERSLDEVIASLRAHGASGDIAGRLLADFDARLAEVAPQLAAAGKDVEEAVVKTRGTIARALGKLRENYEKALLLRDRSLIENVERLAEWIYPHRKPQERVFGLSTFAARHGERALVARIVENAVPFDGTVKDIDL